VLRRHRVPTIYRITPLLNTVEWRAEHCRFNLADAAGVDIGVVDRKGQRRGFLILCRALFYVAITGAIIHRCREQLQIEICLPISRTLSLGNRK